MRCVAEVNQKNPHGNRVFKTQFPSSSSFVLFLFFLHRPFSFLSKSAIPFFSFFIVLFLFFLNLPSHSLLPSPKSPRQFFLLHLNPFLKISNPFLKIQTQTHFSKSQTKNHDLNRSKNPNPKITISAPKRYGFNDLDTEGIFSIVFLLWVFVFSSRFVFSGYQRNSFRYGFMFLVPGLCFLGCSISDVSVEGTRVSKT